MQFYSTKSPSKYVDLKTAVIQSLPPDNGLYMPVDIPVLPKEFFDQLDSASFVEIAQTVAWNLLNGSLPKEDCDAIVQRAINFEAPLAKLTDHLYSLELWHGPSLAFKDFGARFMAELMSYLVKDDNEQLDILVATSGDTGGAVAAGFFNVPNINVTILYPKGKVSPLQQLQLTTWGDNIQALEVDGTFDDCQAMVKTAFLDADVNDKLNLSSANSINIARLIPQSFYYFEAFKQLPSKDNVVFSVPSGNFGNLTAGLLAQRMGLPIQHFIAATNRNNIVPVYLATSLYDPRPSVQTISNAMDVGNPSNFQRMENLFGGDAAKMRQSIEGYYYNDEQTREAVKEIKSKYDYVADPHGAVAYLALQKYMEQQAGVTGVFLETAHPSKFLPVMEPLLGSVDIPKSLSDLRSKQSDFTPMNNDYTKFKTWLLSK